MTTERTYKLTRTTTKQVENNDYRTVTETVATGLTWDEAKKRKKADRSLQAVVERDAAPVTIQ